MRISGKTLDDLLLQLFPKLLASRIPVSPTRSHARELVGVLLELREPRARLSRTETRGKPFSCLGELLWYLSRTNDLDFIRYYIPAYNSESTDGETIFGGYGPRLFSQRGIDQLKNVIQLLTRNPESRRAVIQLFNAEDLEGVRKEIPCTLTLQFVRRQGHLNMLVTMRSNDAYKGLPHDVFCFTMLQEIMATTLGVGLGIYKHFAGSMHLYDDTRDGFTDDTLAAKQYIEEGVQSTILMPPMPEGDPWPSIHRVLEAEARIRQGVRVDANALGLDDYWHDLVRMLQVYAASGDARKIERLKKHMKFPRYAPYIDARKSMPRREPILPRQLSLRL